MVPRRAGRTLVAAVLPVTALALAGCLGSPPDAAPADDVGGPIDAPHVHDRWEVGTRLTIVDRTVETDWSALLPTDPTRAHRPAFVVDIEPKVAGGTHVPNGVLPGTERIDIALEWTGGVDEALRLCVTNEGASGNICSTGLARDMATGGTWTIDRNTSDGAFLDNETWDDPHTLESDWRFQVWLCATGPDDGRCPADVTISSFHLTVTIHRDEPVLETVRPVADDGTLDERRTVAKGSALPRGAFDPVWANPLRGFNNVSTSV